MEGEGEGCVQTIVSGGGSCGGFGGEGREGGGF